MTTEHQARPVVARKRRRPHPARNARLISTGAAAGLTFGVVAALAIGDASATVRAAAGVAVEHNADAFASVNASLTATAPGVTVIRRIHYLPPASTVAPLSPAATVAPLPSAAADAVVFSPQPAVRASAKSTSLPRKRSVVRKAVVKQQAPTRRARRATRAS